MVLVFKYLIIPITISATVYAEYRPLPTISRLTGIKRLSSGFLKLLPGHVSTLW